MRRTISVLAALVTILLMAGLIEWVQLATPNAHPPSSAAHAEGLGTPMAHAQVSLDGRNVNRTQAVSGTGTVTGDPQTGQAVAAPTNASPQSGQAVAAPTNANSHTGQPVAAPTKGIPQTLRAIVVAQSPAVVNRAVVRQKSALRQSSPGLVSSRICCKGSTRLSSVRYQRVASEREIEAPTRLTVGHGSSGVHGQLLLHGHGHRAHGQLAHRTSWED
jgi:hypothetical protein